MGQKEGAYGRAGLKGRFIVTAVIIVCCMVCVGLLPNAAEGTEKKEARVIRVAFPIQEGLSEIDENGVYSGYTYEYLQAIAQYTGWDYEFIQIPGDINTSLLKMMEMLQKGELDLMGGMVYSEAMAETLDFPGVSYGMAYSVLYALEENTAINEMNYQSLQNMRIATLKSAVTRNESMKQFCAMSGITPKIIECDTYEEQVALLKSKEADTMVGVDLSSVKGMRIVARFAPQPYYLATTKGNTDIIGALNSTITKINEIDPYFSSQLYEKYFDTAKVGFLLSDEEREFVEEKKSIRVAVVDGKPPMQSYDRDTGKLWGISLDVMDYIAEKAGLKLEYFVLEPEVDLKEALNSGEYDIALGMIYDFEMAKYYNITMTLPYLSSQIVIAGNKSVDLLDLINKKIALPKEFLYTSKGKNEVVVYDTLEACLDAVNRRTVDYSYGNSYSLQYFANRGRYKNITLIPQSETLEEIAIGIIRPSDIRLLTIINKAIKSISDAEMQGMIYQNSTKVRESITLLEYVDANPREALIMVAVFAFFIITLVIMVAVTLIGLSHRRAIDNERYRQISELSNEYFLEYDYKKDKLILSDKIESNLKMGRVIEHFYENLRKKGDASEELRFLENIFVDEDKVTEMESILPDGGKRWIRITVKVIRSKKKIPVYSISKINDIHEEKLEKELLKEQAQRDSLTNIYNAATCRKLISDYLDLRGEESGAMYIIDIDHFKSVNDKYGHYMGDQVLIEMAGILVNAFRKEDIVARLGGDEFIVLMKGVNDKGYLREKGNAVCRLVKQIASRENIDTITVSIGGAVIGEIRKYEELYKEADRALYIVKNNGKDGCEIV